MILQLWKLISICTIVFTLAQLQNEPSYVRCIDERVVEVFKMKADSSIIRTEYGEGLKGKSKVVGSWQKQNDSIIWKINGLATQSYESDTVSMLQFLIPKIRIQKWSTIRQNLKNNIATNQDIQMLKSFTVTSKNGSKDREDTIEHLEYDIALTITCGEGIMIRRQKEH